jgi:hypothetical protein
MDGEPNPWLVLTLVILLAVVDAAMFDHVQGVHARQVGNGEDINSNKYQSDSRFTEFCDCGIASALEIQLRILTH